MNTRTVWLPLLLTAASIIPALSQDAGPAVSAKARQIHESALVIDTHADTPQRFLDEKFDIGSTEKRIKATSRSIRST